MELEYKIIILCLSAVMKMMPQTENKKFQEALGNARDALNEVRKFM